MSAKTKLGTKPAAPKPPPPGGDAPAPKDDAAPAGPKPPPAVPPGVPCLLDRQQIAFLIGVGLTKFRQMLASGDYPPPDRHLGPQSPRWHSDTHAAWCAAGKGK